MKKTLSLFVTLALLLSLFVIPIHASNAANARWKNTSDTIVHHCYYAGNAECYVYISGYSGATVTNVDIQFDQITISGSRNIASWENLSGGNDFTFAEYVPNIELDCIYRLTFTADVVRNGVVETVSDYLELFYTEDM